MHGLQRPPPVAPGYGGGDQKRGADAEVIAVDTNILVRVLTRDEPTQAARAIAILKANRIFIPITVLLETEWVLRYTYGFERTAIFEGLRKLTQLPQVMFSDPDQVASALDLYEKGIDFADALHVADSRGVNSFVTFDQALCKKAKKLNLPVNVSPP